ncbi:MAG: acetate--CoA ligase family protein, partial [candidate division Zixibacteria bacterium]|nr:acetate--CoA ligase family protein [candidate division Zixibacteria bacterium]
MKIHEYQAKQIFERHGIPVPPGEVVTTAEEAKAIAEGIGKPVMVKSQVHVGGRGKAGGIKYSENPDAAYQNATNIIGMDIKGLTVKKVLITEAVDITSESYVGIIIDRSAKKPVFMVSPAGGIDIEQVAKETPEKIFKRHVDPLLGMSMYEARALGYKLYDDPKLVNQAAKIILQLYDVFMANDASLAEINPLITTPEGQVLAIDAKMNIDDNGLY